MNAARSRLIGVALVAVLMARASPAHAQSTFGVGGFLAGGALALAMHEGGHLTLDLAFDASPGVKGVRFGPLPFFAITHDPVSPAREFAISSAGFWVQHASSEIILTRHPRLREERAPVMKGILAFNVLASMAYAGAALARAGPAERDTRGMALTARVEEPVIGAMVLMPALLDATRYYTGASRWLTWASRASKIGGVLLIARARQ
jgi:hypothetical protein